MKLGYGYVRDNGLVSIDVDYECVRELLEIFAFKADGYVHGKRWNEASEAIQACKELQDLMKEAIEKIKGQEQDAADDYDIVNDPTLPF